jgi:hypothetical protein
MYGGKRKCGSDITTSTLCIVKIFFATSLK